MCINTAYKADLAVDLLIVDEAHKTLSPEFRKVYTNIKHDKLCLLTATLPESGEYREFVDIISPIVYSKKLKDARKHEGLVADFRLYNLGVNLPKYGQHTYDAFSNMLDEAMIKLSQYRKKVKFLQSYSSVFDIAKAASKGLPYDETDVQLVEHYKDIVKYGKQFWFAMSKRRQTVQANDEKIIAASTIIARHPNRQWLIFCSTKKYAERVAKALGGKVYHSGMSTEDRETVLEGFANQEFSKLVSVKALLEGIDIPEVDGALALGFDSVEIDSTQSIGRIIRWKPFKDAIFVNVYSNNTQEKEWARKRTLGLEPIWVTQVMQII